MASPSPGEPSLTAARIFTVIHTLNRLVSISTCLKRATSTHVRRGGVFDEDAVNEHAGVSEVCASGLAARRFVAALAEVLAMEAGK